MPHFQYLIVGGGMTAAAAVASIRKVDEDGSIGLIGRENDLPYDRPPLTKGLWKGEDIDSIWRNTADKGVDAHLGRTATELDPQAKRVIDDQGTEYTFDKLLLATGGTPNHLPFGDDKIIYYRTLADYKRLRKVTGEGQRVAVIGGGFIGSELAAGLSLNGRNVVMIIPEPGIGGKVFPADLAQYVTNYYQDKGVNVIKERRLTDLTANGDQLTLQLSTIDGEQADTVTVACAVAGLGIHPNVELAEQAGLDVDNGIVVDEHLQTSAPDIYAAGDVANFFNPALGERLRIEHEDNANKMGRRAGRIMTGSDKPYDYLPFFYSDLFDLGYEAIGDLDARLETVADWTDQFQKGVIYYLRDGRVRGVLLWNVWGQLKAARQLIAEPGPFQPDDLKGRLPEKD